MGPHDENRQVSGERAILPAALFPPALWFEVARKPDTLVCQHEHYVKQSLRNRIALVQSQGPIGSQSPYPLLSLRTWRLRL